MTQHHTPDTKLQDIDQRAKQRMKEHADHKNRARPSILKPGDIVLCRQNIKGKLMTPYGSKPYTIVKIRGSMVTAARPGHEITRNSSHFKLLPPSVPIGSDSGMTDEEDDLDLQLPDPPDEETHQLQNENINPEGPVPTRYSSRTSRRPPQRLIAEI